ncbi:MAG TPA: hypothetical protein VFA18_14010 [Gemmataceae bacterium]|nr:hypothetical protein [Gemmataceae bacterium]
MDHTNGWKHLVPKPGSVYQQLFVSGGRIAARTLYSYYPPGPSWPGQTVEELAADFDLPVEAVREAIAYCESDPPEIRADLAMEAALAEARGHTNRGSGARVLSPEEREEIIRRARS